MLTYTEAKLANQIIKSISLVDPNCRPLYLEEQSLIFIPERTLQDQSSTTITLENLFNEWKNLSKKDRAECIEELVNATLNPPALSVDERLANLRLRVRTLEELSYRQNSPATGTQSSPLLYGNHGMALELVEDSESHIRIASEDSLEELSITTGDAFKMAVAAHRRQTDATQWQSIGDVWMSNYHDDYDFTRLLIAGNENRFPFEGHKVIAYAPSHSVCLITNQEDAQSLEMLVSIGDQLASEHRTLSKYLWTLSESNQWIPYEFAIDTEAAQVVKVQEIREKTLTYSEQQELLEQKYKSGETHVASYVGFETESGELFSNTTYTLNQASILPHTDIVSIYDDEADGIIGMLSWEEFYSIFGNILNQLPDQLPVRYSIDANVGDEQVEHLKAMFYKKSA